MRNVLQEPEIGPKLVLSEAEWILNKAQTNKILMFSLGDALG